MIRATKVRFSDRLEADATARAPASASPVEPERIERRAVRSTLLTNEPFIGHLAHALRSSLAGIRSWAGLLEIEPGSIATSPLAERAIAGIHIGIDQQVRLIDAICDACTILTGRLQIDRRRMSLRPAIEKAVARMRRDIDDRPVHVEPEIDLVDEAIDGDMERVVQIFEELLRNAVRCTPSGGRIVVMARVVSGRIVVSVADNGRGLPPAFTTWLFDPVRPVETNRHVDGKLGLGLAVTRTLVLLHDGSIEARSAGPGRGTTMTVTLPLSRAWPDEED